MLMENVSERQWAAGWMSGLEEMMWNGSLANLEASRKVRAIARITRVWWVFNDNSIEDDGSDWNRAVPLDDWIARHGNAPEDECNG